jgi:CBS domain-containing protein
MKHAAKTASRPRRVADVMQQDVITVTPDTSVRDVAALLCRESISGVPVVDGKGALLGMVSGTDVLWLADRMHGLHRDFFSWDGLDAFRALDVMTPDVFGVDATADLEELRQFFVRTSVHRAVVLDHGRLVGIVSISDLLCVVAGTSPTHGGVRRL